jgi:hypothetical protein
MHIVYGDDMNDNMTTSRDSSKRAERLQIMITDEELAALDTWRFNAHMPSRSAAVRELLRRGLSAEGYFDQAGKKNQSTDFGILGEDGQ